MDKTIFKFNLFLICLIITISLLCKLLYSEMETTAMNNSSIIGEYLSTNKWQGYDKIIIDSRSFLSAFSVCLPFMVYAMLDILLLH